MYLASKVYFPKTAPGDQTDVDRLCSHSQTTPLPEFDLISSRLIACVPFSAKGTVMQMIVLDPLCHELF